RSMSEAVCTKTQEEYEDDFEKDLDWLISEESRSEDQVNKVCINDSTYCSYKEEKRSNKTEELEEDEERWPSPMEPLEYDSDRDSPIKSSSIVPPPPEMDDQTDEEKKYILEKIQQANRELRDQEAPNVMRRRRLHFKETLVDLVVPPLQFEKDGKSREVEAGKEIKERAKGTEAEVSGKLSELRLSPREERGGSGGACGAGEISDVKESRVLVEKDGKFDLVSMKEVESQGLLPPITNSYSDFSRSSPRLQEQAGGSGKTSPRSRVCSSTFRQDINPFRAPRPPVQPRCRPSSASHSQRGNPKRGGKRRVQSATGTPFQTTYILSSQQKELLNRIQERKEKLAKEAELRKREEEEQKRQENELAFKAWLMRKREQLQEERRIQRAQEMERMNSSQSDSVEAFKLWLHRKQEQQQKERQLVEMKKLEEDDGYLLHSREECERAFKLWVRRKRAEKRAEQQAARERSRRLVLEERRARRMRDLMCSVNEAKTFRFTEQLAHHF
uniref:Coiled-coil domain-containing protein 181 n=1 Tax=Echeneis naucrates TaxID=173247 RepID=A0A665WN30_ECHNA